MKRFISQRVDKIDDDLVLKGLLLLFENEKYRSTP